MHRKSLIALVIVAVLTAPAASATWYFAQTFEPSSEYDTSEWMWADAPPVGESRVYFAVETHHLFALGPYVNPNVGALHTQIEISNGEHHSALLGIWIDCNGDGYVGMAETAVREYAAALLLDTTACPAVSGAPNGWTAGAHNYNGWVSEFIPVARDPALVSDRRVYVDDDARVWGDHHRPDEKPWHAFCPLSPQPRGTWQSTGGVMNYADCRADILGLMNLGFGAIGDPAALRFSDTDDARSGALGQIATFGDENDANRAATVWDCSSQTRSGDTLNETALGPVAPSAAHNIVVTAADPSVDNTDDPVRRVAATVNHTNEGATVAGGSRNCDTSDDFGHDVYTGTCGVAVYCVGESDFNPINPKNKKQAHFNMRYDSGSRGNGAGALVPGGLFGAGGGASSDGGLRWPNNGALAGSGAWTVLSYWLTKPGFSTIRTHFQDPTNTNVEPAPGHWLTFYAHVGTNITSKFVMPGGDGVYASWHCGDNTSGIHNGFNCDRNVWNFNPDGTPYSPGGELENHELARPGDPYELRDVDCYDGGIGALGAGVQPAYYGSDPCY